jgi:DnaJ family protein C protein 19
MAALALGLAVLVFFYLMGRGVISADPKKLARTLRGIGGVLLGLLAVGLAVTGRFAFAIGAAGLSWALLFGTEAPWKRFGATRRDAPGRPEGRMSRQEALNVLGLNDGAGEEDIRAAHRRLIRQAHPDAGGSNYLAAKINEAKDVLLG